MSKFPETFQFELGKYVEGFVDWLTLNYEEFFDALSDGILWVLLKIQNFLLWMPWIIVLLIVFLVAWRIKSWKSGIIYTFMLFIIGTFGLWDEMMMTLALILTSVVISLVIGIPIGILSAYSDRLQAVLKPILDTMQTMPSFVYLIPAIMLFPLGLVPAVFATTIYAVPPAIRLTDLGIRGVSKEIVEASHSFGASTLQTLIKVELPQALPTIMAGVNQTTMMAVAMVVIASMVGAKGVGLNVLIAVNRIDIAMGTEAGLAIVFLAIIIDRLTQAVSKRYKYSE